MEKIKIQVLVGRLLSGIYKTVRYQYHRYVEHTLYGEYEFPYKEQMTGFTAYVLANGPSLKQEIHNLLKEESFMNSPKFVLNFFANTEEFNILKPDYYCLADKGFFIDYSSERYKLSIESINKKTQWKMKLFVPYRYFQYIIKKIENKNIEIVPLSNLQYEGFESKRYEHYKKGYAVPCYVNVTIMIEYILLNMGCKDIRLYGVDHTFFNNMAVNDNNHVCIIDKHFYGDEYIELKRFDGSYFTISEWLMDKYLTFKEHENMRGYADYLGARIVNCTKGSLIDAYVRMAQLEKEE